MTEGVIHLIPVKCYKSASTPILRKNSETPSKKPGIRHKSVKFEEPPSKSIASLSKEIDKISTKIDSVFASIKIKSPEPVYHPPGSSSLPKPLNFLPYQLPPTNLRPLCLRPDKSAKPASNSKPLPVAQKYRNLASPSESHKIDLKVVKRKTSSSQSLHKLTKPSYLKYPSTIKQTLPISRSFLINSSS